MEAYIINRILDELRLSCGDVTVSYITISYLLLYSSHTVPIWKVADKVGDGILWNLFWYVYTFMNM